MQLSRIHTITVVIVVTVVTVHVQLIQIYTLCTLLYTFHLRQPAPTVTDNTTVWQIALYL